MKNILMYCHNGSGNHGCEAIIRSTVGILSRTGTMQYYQITRSAAEDKKYGVDRLVHLLPEFGEVPHRGRKFYTAYLTQKLLRSSGPMDSLSSLQSFCVPEGDTVSLSIGGDNYCYQGYKLYTGYHQLSRKQGHKTVLWGCSVEPEFLDYEDLLEDLRSFDRILVRESLSYQAMYEKGLRNLALYPDPAFTLQPDPMANVFPPRNTVGINISPMALQYGSEGSRILENYLALIRWILRETDMNIALIPHVVWDCNDDRVVLRQLRDAFPDEPRMIMVEDMDAPKLKAYISGLRFLVAARTHASIAAYSTGVPTLVAGYSVKSRGIAQDIFGTDVNYVVSVAHMKDIHEFTEAFRWIADHEQQIRRHLREFMPGYIARAYEAGSEIGALFEEKESDRLQAGILRDSCVGCGACVSACPVDCLHMVQDREGFFYPESETDKCIRCGLCTRVCPVPKPPLTIAPGSCLAVKNPIEAIRMDSSSGGVFPALARQILSQGGVVYGAAMDPAFTVRHIGVREPEQLFRLQGAKYSQSVPGDTYQQVKADLSRQKPVLFSGTPCQVAGLRSYLGRDEPGLICIDMICHGVPSPLVWEAYLREISVNGLPRTVRFRAKDTGWSRYQYAMKAEYPDGHVMLEKNGNNVFLQGMVQDLFLRPACSDCKFKGYSHMGDLTLGDFWGVWDELPEMDDNRGVSAVIVNTRAGAELLEACRDSLQMQEVTLEQITRQNPSWLRSASFPKARADFYRTFQKTGSVLRAFREARRLQLPPKNLLDSLAAIKHRLHRRQHE